MRLAACGRCGGPWASEPGSSITKSVCSAHLARLRRLKMPPSGAAEDGDASVDSITPLSTQGEMWFFVSVDAVIVAACFLSQSLLLSEYLYRRSSRLRRYFFTPFKALVAANMFMTASNVIQLAVALFKLTTHPTLWDFSVEPPLTCYLLGGPMLLMNCSCLVSIACVWVFVRRLLQRLSHESGPLDESSSLGSSLNLQAAVLSLVCGAAWTGAAIATRTTGTLKGLFCFVQPTPMHGLVSWCGVLFMLLRRASERALQTTGRDRRHAYIISLTELSAHADLLCADSRLVLGHGCECIECAPFDHSTSEAVGDRGRCQHRSRCPRGRP